MADSLYRTPSADQGLAGSISDAAVAAGAQVFCHAIDIDTGAECGLRSDDPVVSASVFKVPVLTTYVRAVESGDQDPTTWIRIQPDEMTMGPTGLSVFSDAAEWSLRDVATSMITVSDNAATDIVCELLGIDRINATMAELGLPRTVLIGDCATLFGTMAQDYGTDDVGAVDGLMASDPDRVATLAVNVPSRTNRSTPRESARLLQLLWTDAAAGPEACAEARRILGLQVWPHRLSSGFTDDSIRISGKTGTIGVVRNEIGVVEYPDGRRFAIAVFLRTDRFAYRQPDADRLIGTVGRLLADELTAVRN
jgi:beta-lactamase class A